MSANLENEFIRANTFGKSYTTVQSSYQSWKHQEQIHQNSIGDLSLTLNLGVTHQDYTMTYADLEQTLNKYKRGNPSLIGQEFKYAITTRSIAQKGEVLPTFKVSTISSVGQKIESTYKNDQIEYEIERMKTDDDEDINRVLSVQKQILDIKKEFEEMKKNNKTLSNDGSSFFQSYQALSNHKSPSAIKQAPVPVIEAQNLTYQFAQEKVGTPSFNITNSISNNTLLAPTSQQKKTIQFDKPSNGYSTTAYYNTHLSEHTPPPTRYNYIVEQFGSEYLSGDKNNNSSLTNLSISNNAYKSSTLKKEELRDGEELKLSDLTSPDPAQQVQQNTPLQKIDPSQLRPDQLQHLSVIKEEEVDDSQVDLQLLGSVSSRFKNNLNAAASMSSLNKNATDRNMSSHRSNKNSPNSSFDNQFKMSQISQSQSIMEKIAEIDKKVKQVLSKNEKKL